MARIKETTSARELAIRFGVTESNISLICKGKSWSWLFAEDNDLLRPLLPEHDA